MAYGLKACSCQPLNEYQACTGFIMHDSFLDPLQMTGI